MANQTCFRLSNKVEKVRNKRGDAMSQEFYFCEVEHKNGVVRLAIDASLVIGISDVAFPAPKEIEVFGFALHDGFLYPVVTHSGLDEPVFKYYLILKEYAFGVTRIIEKAQAVPIPFAPDTPLNKDDQFRRLSEYSGVIVATEGCTQQHYYVYNTYCVTLPKTARVVKQDRKNEEKEHIRELKNKYVIVGNTFAMPLSNVLNILSADVVTPFKTEEWDGFIDYNKIIPVKNIDTGKFVVITQNVAYRTSRVAISDGNILRKETSNETYLETPEGIYKILEHS